MRRYQDTNESGFSLLEMLFVLMIVMLLAWIVVPMVHKNYVEHEVNQFFRVFDSDVLFIQNQALVGREWWIHLEEDRYIVKEQKERFVKTRYYPKSFDTQYFAEHRIEYHPTGNVKKPYTYNFYDRNGKRYKVIFSFGKGRHRIEQ